MHFHCHSQPPSRLTPLHLLLLRYLTFMLCVLQVLHVWWFFLFLIMGYNFVFKGKAKDIQGQTKKGAGSLDTSGPAANCDE